MRIIYYSHKTRLGQIHHELLHTYCTLSIQASLIHIDTYIIYLYTNNTKGALNSLCKVFQAWRNQLVFVSLTIIYQKPLSLSVYIISSNLNSARWVTFSQQLWLQVSAMIWINLSYQFGTREQASKYVKYHIENTCLRLNIYIYIYIHVNRWIYVRIFYI